MRRLPATAVAAAVLVVLAQPGHAAPHGYTDARGDTRVDQPGLDILSVTYSTLGTGRGNRYRPTHLVADMTLAGDVIQRPGVTYELVASATSCNELKFTYSSGTVYAQTISDGRLRLSCSPAETVPAHVQVRPGRLTFRVALDQLPEQFDSDGVVLSNFRAKTEVREPVFALVSVSDFADILVGDSTAVDKASSNRKWRLS